MVLLTMERLKEETIKKRREGFGVALGRPHDVFREMIYRDVKNGICE